MCVVMSLLLVHDTDARARVHAGMVQLELHQLRPLLRLLLLPVPQPAAAPTLRSSTVLLQRMLLPGYPK